MARYIDADKLIAHLKDEIEGCKKPFGSRANGKGIAYGTELGLKSAISFANTLATEDVVPKSEVEKAYLNYEETSGLKQAKQEVAREIFEGIEKIIDNEYNKHIFGNNDLDDLEHEAIINFSDCVSSDLEELKKEYKVCDGNCQRCDQAIWITPTSFVGDNRIIGCKWKESEGKT